MKESVAIEQVAKLIKVGEGLISKPGGWEYRDNYAWLTSCHAFVLTLGRYGQPWETAFQQRYINTNDPSKQVGSLEGIKYSLENGLFSTVEDFVRADLFGDLIEQAQYLFEQGFHVAAAVVARAVFDEHLKKKCIQNNCLPAKQKPMLGDFITELSKPPTPTIDAIATTWFRGIAQVGNDAAHGKNPMPADIDRMIKDVVEVLNRFPN